MGFAWDSCSLGSGKVPFKTLPSAQIHVEDLIHVFEQKGGFNDINIGSSIIQNRQMDFMGISKCNFLEPSSHTCNLSPVFRLNRGCLTEQYFHDIDHFIPNMMVRIYYDGNLPNPVLSFAYKTNDQNSGYEKIPEGVDVVFFAASATFQLEYFSTVKKVVGSRNNFVEPHNDYTYNLMPYNNYQIRYKDQVVMNLVIQFGWNIS